MYIHNLIFKKKFDFIFLKILFWNMLDDIFSEINQRMVRDVPSRLICNIYTIIRYYHIEIKSEFNN